MFFLLHLSCGLILWNITLFGSWGYLDLRRKGLLSLVDLDFIEIVNYVGKAVFSFLREWDIASWLILQIKCSLVFFLELKPIILKKPLSQGLYLFNLGFNILLLSDFPNFQLLILMSYFLQLILYAVHLALCSLMLQLQSDFLCLTRLVVV